MGEPPAFALKCKPSSCIVVLAGFLLIRQFYKRQYGKHATSTFAPTNIFAIKGVWCLIHSKPCEYYFEFALQRLDASALYPWLVILRP
jgi:hypothetical protein